MLAASIQISDPSRGKEGLPVRRQSATASMLMTGPTHKLRTATRAISVARAFQADRRQSWCGPDIDKWSPTAGSRPRATSSLVEEVALLPTAASSLKRLKPQRKYKNSIFPNQDPSECEPPLRAPSCPAGRRGACRLEYGLLEQQDLKSKDALDASTFDSLVSRIPMIVHQACVRMNDLIDRMRTFHSQDASFFWEKAKQEALVEVCFEAQTAQYYFTKWRNDMELAMRKTWPTSPLQRPTKLDDWSTEDLLAQLQGSIPRMEIQASQLCKALRQELPKDRQSRMPRTNAFGASLETALEVGSLSPCKSSMPKLDAFDVFGTSVESTLEAESLSPSSASRRRRNVRVGASDLLAIVGHLEHLLVAMQNLVPPPAERKLLGRSLSSPAVGPAVAAVRLKAAAALPATCSKSMSVTGRSSPNSALSTATSPSGGATPCLSSRSSTPSES